MFALVAARKAAAAWRLSGQVYAVAAVTLAAVGCNSDAPDIVNVSGTVTRNGKPVPFVDVYFQPTEGRPSLGTTDEQGHFDLRYTHDQDGAKVGNHTVFVVFNPPADTNPQPPADLSAILQKYGGPEKSPIKIEVKHAQRNLEIKLD